MQIRKRNWLAVTLLVMVSMVLSSCGGTGDATPTQVTQPTVMATAMTQPTQAMEPTAMPATSPTAGSTTMTGSIEFQVFGDPAELKVFQAVADAFNKSHPGATVNIVHIPNQGDHMTKLSTAMTAGNPPDVFLINYRRYGQFAAKGVIEPAGPLLAKSATLKEDLYYPEALNAFKYKGVLQCIPQNVSNLVVYYNKDLFTKYKVPFPKADWTWNDFLGAATAITQDTNADGKKETYGVSVEPQIIRLAPFVWSNGGDIVDNPDKPTMFTLTSGPARDAVQFFTDLQLAYKVVPTEAEAKAEDGESMFMNGKLGMILQSRAATPSFREITSFQWDVAPLPMQKQKASILHSDAYCIAAASKNKDLAWSFVEYAQGVEGQEVAAKLGRTVPSLKSVASSPAFLDPSLSPASSQVFLDAVPTLKLVPVLSTWPQIEGIVNAELEQAFYGLKTVDAALQKATDDTKALFAEGVADRDK
jgi:multiple sugar transport system substrate-binding protein